MLAGQEMARRRGRGWSRLHLQTRGSGFLWAVPFIKWRFQDIALLVFDDDSALGGANLAQLSELVVRKLHLYKDESRIPPPGLFVATHPRP